MTTYDLTTIGEGQIRLTVDPGGRLATARSLRMTAACSEANVAGLLAQLGRKSVWLSKLPATDLGRRVVQEFHSVGVDTDYVATVPTGRVALYFMEPGNPPMPAQVTYDREHTPFRTTTPDDYNWAAVLSTRVLFVTGITASLTPETAGLIRYAVDAAIERGVPVALDVNYRSLLWSGDEARAVLQPIAERSAIVCCSRRDAIAVFGLKGADGERTARELRELFGCPSVVSTDHINGVYLSNAAGESTFPVEEVPVVDRPGAGDAFVAGVLHGWLDGELEAGINYGLRSAALALTHHGDLTHIAPRELEAALTTDIVR